MLKLHPAAPHRYPVLYDPGTLMLIAGISSAVIGAGSAVAGGIASRNQADAQAKVLRQQAAYETASAAAQEAEYRQKQDRLMATRRAMLGGAGVDPTTGSPLLASEDLASEVELQALKIRQGGAVASIRKLEDASLLQDSGMSDFIGGLGRGGSLLLSGAGDTWGNLYQIRNPPKGS